MKRLSIVALFIFAGCGYFEGASVRDMSTMVLYSVQRKQLMFVQTPCPRSDKPMLVSAWVREKDVSKMVVLCDAECNCRWVKRTPKMKIISPTESGICQ